MVEAIISKIKHPETFEEAQKIKVSLGNEVTAFTEFRPNNYKQTFIDESLIYLKSLCTYRDDKKIMKLVYGLQIIYRFFINKLSDLYEFFDALLTCNALVLMRCVADLITTVSTETSEANEQFASRYLNMAIGLVTARVDFNSNMMGLHLINEFTIKLPYFINYSHQQTHALLWDYVRHQNAKIRDLATECFLHHISALTFTHSFSLRPLYESIFNVIIEYIGRKQKNPIIGPLRLLAKLLTLRGDFFQAHFEKTFSILENINGCSNHLIRAHVCLVKVALCHSNQEYFLDKFFGPMINEMLIISSTASTAPHLIEVLQILIKLISEKVLMNISPVFIIIKNINKNVTPTCAHQLIEIINSFLVLDPRIIQNNSRIVWEVICDSIFNERLIDFLPRLTSSLPGYLNAYSTRMCSILIEALDAAQENALPALRLLPFIPVLNNEQRRILVRLTQQYLFSKSPEQRAASPRAILHVSKHPCPIKKITKILIVSQSESSEAVRSAFIECFEERHLSYITQSSLINTFRVLAKDESPRVRISCYKMLSVMEKYSPVQVDIITTQAIKFHFHQIHVAETIRHRIEMMSSFPCLMGVSINLNKLFSSQIVQLAVDYLKKGDYTTEALEVVDSSLLFFYAVKLIQSVQEYNKSEDFPCFNELISAYKTLLSEYSAAKIKKAVIESLSMYANSSDNPSRIYEIAPELLDILMRIASSSNFTEVRVAAIMFIAQVGAVNPKNIHSPAEGISQPESFTSAYTITDSICLETFFGQSIIKFLLEIVKDRSLVSIHSLALSTVINVFSYIPNISQDYLYLIYQIILNKVESGNMEETTIGFRHIIKLIQTVKQRIYPLISDIVKHIISLWQPHYLLVQLDVIKALIFEVHSDISSRMNDILPLLLKTMRKQIMENPSQSAACISVIALITPMVPSNFLTNITEIVDIVDVFNDNDELLYKGLEAVLFLIQNMPSVDHFSLIFNFGSKYVRHSVDEISNIAKQVIYTLYASAGKRGEIYSYMAESLFLNDIASLKQCRIIIESMCADEPPSLFSFGCITKIVFGKAYVMDPIPNEFDSFRLSKAFSVSKLEAENQWLKWYKILATTVVKISPFPFIRECYEIACLHEPFADFLMFPSLLSCWLNLAAELKLDVSQFIIKIIYHHTVPKEIVQKFATVCEKMYRAKYPVNIPEVTLINIFNQAKMYSLAFFFAEKVFFSSGNTEIIPQLLGISHQIGKDNQTAHLVQKGSSEWYLKTSNWESAISEFGKEVEDESIPFEDFQIYIKAATKLRRYDLIRKSAKIYESFPLNQRRNISFQFAESMFFGKDYKMMTKYCKEGSSEDFNNQALLALSMVLNGQYSNAEEIVNYAFYLVAQQESQRFKSLYSSVYPTVATCENLIEVLELAKSKGKPPVKIWNSRIEGSNFTSDVWWKIIKPRLVYTSDDKETFIKAFNSFIDERNFAMYKCILDYIYPDLELLYAEPDIVHTYLRYMWGQGNTTNAISLLYDLTEGSYEIRTYYPIIYEYTDWVMTLNGRNSYILHYISEIMEDAIRNHYSDEENFSALNQRWARANYLLYRLHPLEKDIAVNAVMAFVPSINAYGENFADISQLLSIFFQSAHDPDIIETTSVYFNQLNPILFQNAIPQLISQLGNTCELAANAAARKLMNITDKKIQAVLFPLLFAASSDDPIMVERAAMLINYGMATHSDVFAEASQMRDSLIDAAFSIFEKWRAYNDEDDVLDLIEIAQTAKTPMERLFMRINYELVSEIEKRINEGRSFDDYIQRVINNCDKFLYSSDTIKLSDINGDTKPIRAPHVSIPGHPYEVKLEWIEDTLQVMASQQHPRKVNMLGDDGITYSFLLKPNEDLQLDQRVMQFFTLVNSVTKNDYQLASESIRMRTYYVMPISDSIGLIQWVEGSDSIGDIITSHREALGQEVFAEQMKLTKDTIYDPNFLRPIQRLEEMQQIFKEASPDDLRIAFFLRNGSAEEWLAMRERFQKSMGISSMVGYILGLGDRHPYNVMIDRNTGDVIHIDLGDCFDFAAMREYFPELIPFRLTRMIVRSFGIGGISATFMPVCYRVMSVARENCNALVSVLEMFVHEPQSTMSDFEEIAVKQDTILRLWDKLTGNHPEFDLTVEKQIDILIKNATDSYNFAHLYSGWCPFW